MAFYLLPLIVVAFFFGINQLVSVQTQNALPPAQTIKAGVSAETFLVYRDACVKYAKANTGFTGSISPALLVLPPGVMMPSGLSNSVTSVSGGRQIAVWGTLSTGAPYSISQATGGDATVGLVTAGSPNQWVSPSYGNMGAAPVFAPAGSTLSLVTISP